MPFPGLFKKNRNDFPVEIIRKVEADPYYVVHDDSNWLLSYADMMTLLCGFFILLFSISSLDASKYDKVRESVAKQFGGTYQSNPQDFAAHLDHIVQEKGLRNTVSVKYDARGAILTFQTATFFDTLSTELLPDAAIVLFPLIDGIHELEIKKKKTFLLAVEGHTDSRAVLSGPYPTNWELSSARAARVVRAFIDKGFQPEQLSAVGFADSRANPSPAPPDADDEERLSRNRRVVIRVFEAEAPMAEYSAGAPSRIPAAAAAAEAMGPPH